MYLVVVLLEQERNKQLEFSAGVQLSHLCSGVRIKQPLLNQHLVALHLALLNLEVRHLLEDLRHLVVQLHLDPLRQLVLHLALFLQMVHLLALATCLKLLLRRTLLHLALLLPVLQRGRSSE